jgi:hypothetical protein
LRDTVPWTNDKGLIHIEVLQNHLDLARIVRVDDTCKDVKAVLHGQSAPWRQSSISSGGKLYGDTGGDDHAATWENDVAISAEEVVPSCVT